MKATIVLNSLVMLGLAVPALSTAADKPAAHADKGHGHAKQETKVTHGVVCLQAMKDSGVKGEFTLLQKGDIVLLEGKVTGLTPGLHGFHIHEFGDLRAADGTSAGGHYNPSDAPHGGPDNDHRHAGDMGNIEANDQGVAEVKKEISGATLKMMLGRSLVVHADPDDLKSQPSGNAGARIAVGVIGVAAADKK